MRPISPNISDLESKSGDVSLFDSGKESCTGFSDPHRAAPGVEPGSMKNPQFVVRSIHHSFNSGRVKHVEVLSDINFSINKNEFVSIVGPSGCGKSTLLNIMSGLIEPSGGEILFEGKKHAGISNRIGYISQNDSLMPWRTAVQNVEIGMELNGVPRKKRREIALGLIRDAELSGFENSYPFQLSGGMKKRVDIIKVLAIEPEIIFMDEPFGALDVFTREMLQNYILALWHKTKKTIVFITHDLSEAITLADRVIIMTGRPARIKSEYEINLPRPRSSVDIRFNDEFISIHRRIWEDLKGEVHRREEKRPCA